MAAWFISNTLGPIIRGGVTTSVTSGLEKIFRRRMTDFIVDSIAARAENFVETPLDLDLPTRTLGPLTGALVGEVNQFLGDLLGRERIRAFSVDPFSGNTQTDIDAGRWIILISVKLVSAAEEIVLKATIGEFVEVTDA